MEIKKGTILEIQHSRKGHLLVCAMEDFDTDTTEFYPVRLAQQKSVDGASVLNRWFRGDKIPCRNTLCKILKIVDS